MRTTPTAPRREPTRDELIFLQQWLREPTRIGAVAPSSPRLAAAITVAIPADGAPVVVELGPGTGAFTGEIQRRLGGRGRHIAVEINPGFARHLRSRFPTLDVAEADAEHLPATLAARGLTTADVVVSSLPWASFGPALQRRLTDAVTTTLSPDSVFATFAYLHAQHLPQARRFRTLLGERFAEVTVGHTVWCNLPPAYVLQARRPRRP
ncbi:class I SAM-dependent methyltransferase [Mycolicibacterium poriferae]|nr:methyltransferase domain-containing protein [Mycolicibacterium poriferae]MCV7263527.1 methyltransferase domain-containing protein [Mycolicibacterium poriferae]